MHDPLQTYDVGWCLLAHVVRATRYTWFINTSHYLFQFSIPRNDIFDRVKHEKIIECMENLDIDGKAMESKGIEQKTGCHRKCLPKE